MLELEKKESMGIKMMHWRIGELLRRRKQEKGEGGMHVLLENILAIFFKTKNRYTHQQGVRKLSVC